jgi:MFS family permease
VIGLVLAAQFLPVPVLGAYGGLIADRVPKRPLLLGTQTAHTTLHGGADVFGFLTSAMGAGAVAGGLLVATFSVTGLAPLTSAAVGFGLAVLAAALVPTLATELVALVLVGAASTAFMATGNSTLQLTSDPSFRGRVMALWAVTFQGSTPIGGPIIGAVSEYASPRFGLALGALACLLAAALGATALRRTPPGERSAPHPAQMDWITYQQAHNGP